MLKNLAAALLLVLVGTCLSGCATMPKTFEQGLELIDKGADLAEKQGVAFNATLEWNGDVGVSFKQVGALETGMLVKLNFHGNAASQRATVAP